jgi:RimJ/RimL family protein N-acetyltransferase
MTDTEELHRIIFGNPEVTWLGGRVATLDETRQCVEVNIWRSDHHETFLAYAVTRKADGVLMGMVVLSPYLADFVRLKEDPQPEYNSIEVELGYAFGTEYQGQGYATEACRAMIEHAFNTLRLRRLVNTTSDDNAPSIALMKRLGFEISHNRHPKWSHESIGVLNNT